MHNKHVFKSAKWFQCICIRKRPPTCRRHLIRSPGAMIAVVKTPDSIPAANSCGYLLETHTTSHSQETWMSNLDQRRQSNHLRKDIVWGSLLEFLAETESKKANRKHGCNSDDWGRHAFIQPLHALEKNEKHIYSIYFRSFSLWCLASSPLWPMSF